ncbi:MAG: AmmeMemoRadiSam system radical SAM enzyme [Bacteroidales bacterium]|nr:AmmeMemoRadiSam system radical SAM enzyme [Bacteroidales bacterium]HPM18434.1 AmmeMemoRadiSam system radical SAM enzyme [Bacteroidales bacterium]HQG77364.1 AmmeMemoRadiSam system radical SAM enzyme [Bacteroidales bacterium]
MGPLYLKYDRYIECRLCPHRCKIPEGKSGICGVRKNTGDRIELITYNVISGHALDPVEKKPLYHFFPGHKILSIGSYGCNMRCDFCQNWHISQHQQTGFRANTSIDCLLEEARQAEKNIGIAFTYNEPIIWLEFMRDTAVRFRENGFFTVMVSNGYVNTGPLNEITGFIDAFNIDLKAFNETFYKKLTGADLENVRESLRFIAKKEKHLEITTLIIPGRNDSPEEMRNQVKWIAGELGEDVPLHLSRYFPMYRRQDPATPKSTLDSLHEIASRYLKYVYLGNTDSSSGQDTRCPKCGITVTKRIGYGIRLLNLSNEGNCLGCGTTVYRNFTFSGPNH